MTGVDCARTHGNVGTYRIGCRCRRCKNAHNAARRDYKARKKTGDIIREVSTEAKWSPICTSCWLQHNGECA